MSYKIAQRVARLSESETLKMAKIARQLKAEGKDIISLSIGEPDFNTPDHIKDAAIKAIHDNITHYPPVSGFPELKKAIVDRYVRDFNVTFQPNQIVVSNGAKQSLSNVVLSLIDHDDEVIVPSPYWVSYPEMVKLAGGKIVEIKGSYENDYKITPQQLEEAITPKTRLFIFSTPSNPSGGVYCIEELRKLGEVFKKHPQVMIMSDEIYDCINFLENSCSFSQIQGLEDRMIIINGVSKGFAMTGWRIGYMIAPEWLATACDKLQGQTTSGASSVSMMAALAAMNSDLTPTQKMRDEFLKRRDLVYQKLSEIPGIKINKPDGAFYNLLDVQSYFGKSYQSFKINDSEDLTMFLLEAGLVSAVSGKAFGVPECIRISFATSEENLLKAIERMKNAFSLLK